MFIDRRAKLSTSFHSNSLLFYSAILFFVFLGDGIMSYLSPVFIENQVNNQFIMGLIFSTSSIVGISCDFFFSGWFRGKNQLFFLWSTVCLALLFPLVFLFLPHVYWVFFLAMAVWGVYYEFLAFSNFHFVESYVKRDGHAFAWGSINIFRCFGLLVAPLVSSTMLKIHYSYPLWTAAFFYSASLLGIYIFKRTFPDHHKHAIKLEVKRTYGFAHQLRVWKILLSKIWPIYLFVSLLFIVESSFFTIGVLLSEKISEGSIWGNFLLPAYILPSLFMGVVVQKLVNICGKKRTAFASGAVAGGIMCFVGFATAPWIIVVLFFCSALFTSLALPAILGASQDYISRLGVHESEMIGLQTSANSISYILGPILAGAVATTVGDHRTFSVIGVILLCVSLLCLWVVPRKVRLPQKALENC